MKNEKWLSGFLYSLLAVGIAMGGLGCLVTAFPVEHYAQLSTVLFWCSCWAAVTAVCLSVRKGGWILLGLMALLLGYFWREGTLERHLELLIYRVTSQYDKGYGWGTVSWSSRPERAGSIDGALILWGCFTVTVLLWNLLRRMSILPGLLVSILPLASCCVLTDSIPDTEFVFLLLIPLVLLLLSQAVRRREAKGGLRLTALLLIPVLLAGLLLSAAMPKDQYELQLDTLRQQVLSWVNGLPFVVQAPDGQLTISMDGTVSNNMDLSAVGPRTGLRYAVMDVISPRTQTLYLRGQAFDLYSGDGWTAMQGKANEENLWPECDTSVGSISISTRINQPYLYTTYYSGHTTFRQGRLNNDDQLRQYSIPLMDATGPAFPVGAPAKYKELPEDTAQWACLLVNKILIDRYGTLVLTQQEKVEAICEYVENAASYDLNTPRMPEDETDFARWFLEESETGYCIHFATAATVLLRAAGVPARYISGYCVEVAAGRRTIVTADRAHAWVEYLDETMGWTVVDPTPGLPAVVPDPTQTPTEEPTEPPTQEPTQEPTQPPTQTPTEEPTEPPTQAPTLEPTESQPTLPASTEATVETQTQPQTVVPTGSDPVQTVQRQDRGLLWTVLKILCWIVGCLVVIIGQYLLRRYLRRKKLRSGHPNQQALAHWRYVLLLAKILKLTPPEALEELADKAKFSQHTLTDREVQEFALWIRRAEDALQARAWPLRLMLRLIFAI